MSARSRGLGFVASCSTQLDVEGSDAKSFAFFCNILKCKKRDLVDLDSSLKWIDRHLLKFGLIV